MLPINNKNYILKFQKRRAKLPPELKICPERRNCISRFKAQTYPWNSLTLQAKMFTVRFRFWQRNKKRSVTPHHICQIPCSNLAEFKNLQIIKESHSSIWSQLLRKRFAIYWVSNFMVVYKELIKVGSLAAFQRIMDFKRNWFWPV